MRVLFSGVPAFGHLLPLVPFVRSASAQGHQVAVLTSASMQAPLALELPDVTFLAAGPDPMQIVAEVARHFPGADPMNNPQPETVADFFAGARIDLAYDEALAAASAWDPDVVIVDAADFVGPMVAVGLGIGYAMVAFGPEIPPEFSAPMIELAAGRYGRRGLAMKPPLAIVDPAPLAFQAPDWARQPMTLAYRSEPYRRTPDAPAFHVAKKRPKILVTLGTVFNDKDLLADIVRSVAALEVDVVVTLGVQLTEPPLLADNVTYEAFRPLAELLSGVDVVITTGGGGTVLAAASAGIPMVVLPQGADQFINAERATAAGVAITTTEPTTVAASVQEILTDSTMRATARTIAADVAARPDADTVLAQILERVVTDQG